MTDYTFSNHRTPPSFPPRTYEDHFVKGTAEELANIWANHEQAGTLITWLKPQQLSDGRFEMMFRLRTGQPPTPRPTTAPTTRPTVRVTSAGDYARNRIRRSRRTRIAAVTGVVAGLAAVAAYLLGQLVELVAAHAALVLGVLGLTAILAAAAVRRSSSGRRHCPGC